MTAAFTVSVLAALAIGLVIGALAGPDLRRRGVTTGAGRHAGPQLTPDGPPAGAPHRPVNGRSLGTMPRKQVPDRAPWSYVTGSFPALTETEEELARAAYVRRQVPECSTGPQVLQRVHTALLGQEVTR